MQGLIIFIISTLFLIVILFVRIPVFKRRAKLRANFRELLFQHVLYYRSLSNTNKIRFEEKINDFLFYVKIHGVKTEVTDLDKLLVASSAVIPVFGFDNWRYYNLHDVLLYPDTFDRDNFSVTDLDRNTLGMVGTGPMQRIMILSKPALHEGFLNEISNHNTGIHEFVHLVDKADGATDGIPQQLLNVRSTVRWKSLMNEEIEKIKKEQSDIDAYAATSTTEFFAVVAEYFFQQPNLLKERHTELFEMMTEMFQQNL
jgi:MtfA peptidase